MKKIALILGITGQDGSYLAELLIKKKYQVHGIKRRTSTPNTSRIDHIFDSVNFNNKDFYLCIEYAILEPINQKAIEKCREIKRAFVNDILDRFL